MGNKCARNTKDNFTIIRGPNHKRIIKKKGFTYTIDFLKPCRSNLIIASTTKNTTVMYGLKKFIEMQCDLQQICF